MTGKIKKIITQRMEKSANTTLTQSVKEHPVQCPVINNYPLHNHMQIKSERQCNDCKLFFASCFVLGNIRGTSEKKFIQKSNELTIKRTGDMMEKGSNSKYIVMLQLSIDLIVHLSSKTFITRLFLLPKHIPDFRYICYH